MYRGGYGDPCLTRIAGPRNRNIPDTSDLRNDRSQQRTRVLFGGYVESSIETPTNAAEKKRAETPHLFVIDKGLPHRYRICRSLR
jgi:hypothetical protein